MKNKIFKGLALVFVLMLGVTSLIACDITEPLKKESENCVVTFKSITENIEIDESLLPQIDSIEVDKNGAFLGVESINGYAPVEYRVYITENYYRNIYLCQQITTDTCVTIVWDYNQQNSDEDCYNFMQIQSKIGALEVLSEQYNEYKKSTKNPQLRVLQYIRNVSYGGYIWGNAAGSVETDFIDYVNEKNPELATLQTLGNFVSYKTNESVDFVHLMATLNAIIYKGYTDTATNDLVGWGGDLCQLAIQVKAGQSVDLLGQDSASSSFSGYDLRADLDAINMTQIYNSLVPEYRSISNVFAQYYIYLNPLKRKQEFLINAFPEVINSETGEIVKSESEFSNIITDRVINNGLLKIWGSTNSFSLTNTTNKQHVATCSTKFAQYFMD